MEVAEIAFFQQRMASQLPMKSTHCAEMLRKSRALRDCAMTRRAAISLSPVTASHEWPKTA
jgi:hypothetical protein